MSEETQKEEQLTLQSAKANQNFFGKDYFLIQNEKKERQVEEVTIRDGLAMSGG
jgi:hypothetical protein